jgi:hypothetical protein
MLEGIGMDEERSDEGLAPRQHVDLVQAIVNCVGLCALEVVKGGEDAARLPTAHRGLRALGPSTRYAPATRPLTRSSSPPSPLPTTTELRRTAR